MIRINILVPECDDRNNGGCGKSPCIQVETRVKCLCDSYDKSDEDHLLARGNIIIIIINNNNIHSKKINIFNDDNDNNNDTLCQSSQILNLSKSN